MRSKHTLFIVLLTVSFVALGQAQTKEALPFVSPMFGNNMVLQRGKANPIWGWSEPGDQVRVEIAGSVSTAVAGADGRWTARIQPPAPGGPYTLRITGKQKADFHEVLVGDVWLCGGQSNMQFGLRGARNGAEEVSAAYHPEIRFFVVQQNVSYGHTAVPRGSWRIVSPETAAQVSAVAYFFARRVQEDVPVPIGLVVDAVGGTPAEAWTSAGALRALEDFDPAIRELDRLRTQHAPEYGNFIMHWYDEYDAGIKGSTWAAPDLDESDWKTVEIPTAFGDLGVPATPSVVWFRKEITLPDPVPAGRTTLQLGSVEKMDTAYVNGRWVGASAWVENPRVYGIPEGVLKPGRNVVAVRVFKIKPDGGFLDGPDRLRLVLANGTAVPLAGKWKAKLSVDARPPHPMPLAFENWPIMPSVLYEGMLAPLAPLAITGALWYQGEQNSDRGPQYAKLLPVMIEDWRRLFAQGDFPFYIVSLPAFGKHRDTPGESDNGWAELRDAQAKTAATVANTCLAVTIDTGDANNIHPTEKLPAGERLARCALANYYGKSIPFRGPTLSSVERIPGALRLHFDHAEGGLVAKGGKAEEFAIAGEDRKWHWAEARVEGDAVVVSSPDVADPRYVRYAWQGNPAATLFNAAGLPAVPFRTDP